MIQSSLPSPRRGRGPLYKLSYFKFFPDSETAAEMQERDNAFCITTFKIM